MRKMFTVVAAAAIIAASFWGPGVGGSKVGAQTMKRAVMLEREQPEPIGSAADAQAPARPANELPAVPEITATVVKQQGESFEVPAKRIDGVIATQAGGRELREVVRVFSGGSQVDYPGVVEGLVRKSATYYPDTKVLVVRGEAFGSEVVEDIRLLELDGEHVVLLRDIYLDGRDADLSIGRGLPFEIGGDGAQESAESGKLGKGVSMAAAVAKPSIISISGVTNTASGISNGKVAMGRGYGPTWDGSYAINNETGSYPLTLNGSNFGTKPGSVVLAGRSAKIISWSNTAIKIDPTYPYDAGPVCAVLKVTTASGGVLNWGLNIVSAIKTRIYGQCTHHVAWYRLRMGKQPSPTAYSGYTTITGSYVPTVGDQYQFNKGAHTAILIGVSGPALSTGGVKTWTLTVSEQNAKLTNKVGQYTTYFKTKTVGTSTSVLDYPKASYNTSYSSTSYYR